jgi:hypothetical protein
MRPTTTLSRKLRENRNMDIVMPALWAAAASHGCGGKR